MTPDQAEGFHRQGLIAAQAGRLDEALDLIAQAITANPGVAAWWANYGLVLESKGDALGAVQAYAGALNLDGGLALAMDGLLAMAQGLRDAGRANLAEGCYRRALALAPAAVTATANAGVLLRAQGRRDEAAVLYRRAAALEPDNWIHPYNLGNALAELDRLGAAESAFRGPRRWPTAPPARWRFRGGWARRWSPSNARCVCTPAPIRCTRRGSI
jgi:protein O-GlcNAc transferase